MWSPRYNRVLAGFRVSAVTGWSRFLNLFTVLPSLIEIIFMLLARSNVNTNNASSVQVIFVMGVSWICPQSFLRFPAG
jgi:ABC-type multidrug transport system permease subunit